jgi:hypothetical protein
MGRTIISEDGRFEWDEEKNSINYVLHQLLKIEYGFILSEK